MLTLDELNARLDQAIGDRVLAHRQRERREITVEEYLARLRAVRDAEDEIEPQRRALGARRWRAWDLTDEQADVLAAEMAAARVLGRRVDDGRMSPRHHLSRKCDCQAPSYESACGSCPSRALPAEGQQLALELAA